MTPEQPDETVEPQLNDRLWHDLLAGVQKETGEAAQSQLEAGRPIYYSDDATPDGLLIKKHPDGRCELVRFAPTGDEIVRRL